MLSDTRPGLVSSPRPASSGIGWCSLAQMGLAVAAVAVGIRWAIPKLLRPFPRSQSGPGAVRVLETRQLGPAGLHLVEVEGRRLLLAVTPASVELITELQREEQSFDDYLASSDLKTTISQAAARLGDLSSE